MGHNIYLFIHFFFITKKNKKNIKKKDYFYKSSK